MRCYEEKKTNRAELKEIKNEVKAILKKIKEKVVVTEQPDFLVHRKEMTFTIKTKLKLTNLMNLLPKTLKKLVK